MDKRILGILVILGLIIMAGLVINSTTSRKRVAGGELSRDFLVMPPFEVTQILIGREGVTESVLIRKVGGVWMTGTPELRAERHMVDAVLKALTTPVTGTLRARKESSWDRYGVGPDDGINVSLRSESDPMSMLSYVIGNVAPGGTYVREKYNYRSRQTYPAYTYEVSAALRHLVANRLTAEAWRSRDLLNTNPDLIRVIAFRRPGQPLLRLERGEGNAWQATVGEDSDAATHPADPGIARALVNALLSIRAADFIDKPQQADTEGAAAVRWSVTLNVDGVEEGSRESSITLTVGAESAKRPGFFYARKADTEGLTLVDGFHLRQSVEAAVERLAVVVPALP